MMKKFTQIDNGVVTAYLETTGSLPDKLPEGRSFVEVEEFPALLSTYDKSTKTFTSPPPPPDHGRTVSTRDFLMLFTQAERLAIRAAAKTDDTVADWYAIALEANGPIRLKHPTTLAGLNFLVAKGLLTAARRDFIING